MAAHRAMMLAPAWVLLTTATFVSGCATSSPFPGAVRGRMYSIEEFHALVIAEKEQILQTELRRLRAPTQDAGALSPFVVRQFPRWSEWQQLKRLTRPGDIIQSYHHSDYVKYYDGPVSSLQRGYALVRNDRIVRYLPVDTASTLEY